MLKHFVRNWIRSNADGRIVRYLIRRAEGFLYLAYNQSFWDFDRNGEARVLDIVRQNVGARTPIVLDVGAHFGEWCDCCLSVMPNAVVLSFELIPEQAEQAREHHRANASVTVFDFGLSDSDRDVEISYNPAAGRGTSINPRQNMTNTSNSAPIKAMCRVRRGDQVRELQALQRIDLLKIDTEGHELSVLRGLTDILEQPKLRPTIIQFEYGQTFIPYGANLEQIYRLLEPLGYCIGRVGPNGVNFKPYEYSDEHFRMEIIWPCAGIAHLFRLYRVPMPATEPYREPQN